MVFALVAALSLGILDSSGLDARARETASLIEARNESIQKHTQVLDTSKLGHLSKIQSILDLKRGPSSIQNLN